MKNVIALILVLFAFFANVNIISSAPTVSFDAQQNRWVQVNANGSKLTTGCGFGFIGSQTGIDDSGNITSCNANNGGVMRPFNGNQNPNLPFNLSFAVDNNDNTKLNFTGSLGSSSTYNFATVSMPMDLNRNLFTKFTHSGMSSTTRDYSSLAYCYTRPDGSKVYCESMGRQSWGEAISSDYKIRVVVTNSSRPVNLFFVNHPDTRNIEFSFGQLKINESVSISGYIKVSSNTQPALTFEAERNLSHQIGRLDADGWSVNVNDSPKKYMCFGPYSTNIASGTRTATFNVMLDNVTANNNLILTLDIYDANSGRVLASRNLTRKQFTRAFTYQGFDLQFSASTNQRLEFRTYWHGGSYVRQNNVVIR